MSSKTLIKITFLMLLTVLIFFACAKKDPALLLQQYETAYNSHNVDNIEDLLADSVIFKFDETMLIEGKDDIKNLIQYDSVLNAQLVFSNVQVSGDTAHLTLTEKNDWLKMANVEEYPYGSGEIVFDNDGKITFFRVDEDKTSAKDFNKIFTSIVDWAQKDHKEEVDDLLETGYNARNAERWLTLLKQWQDDQETMQKE